MISPTRIACIASLLTPFATADITWTGAVSDDIFDEANWDLTNSTVTIVDPNVSVNDNVIVPQTAVSPIIPDVAGQQRFQVGDGFTLTIDGGSIGILGNDGVGGEPQSANGPIMELINGASFQAFFITNDVDMRVDGTSSAMFDGPNNPVNGSTIEITGNALLHFTAETPTDYINEHLSKTTVNGAPAVVGTNLMVVTDNAAGCFVTVISSSLGASYCSPSVVNSAGLSATIIAEGSDVAADNDVTLTASDLPANQFGYFLNSQQQGFVPMPGGSQGNICLSGGIGRYNPAAGYPVVSSGAGGSIVLSLDLSSTPTPAGTAGVVAGETWNFQCWYRDLNPMPVSNFTDGVSVTFQ